ncbi:MAG: ATP-binding protein [Planctomycetota bacterium]
MAERILLCNCSKADIIPEGTKVKLLLALAASGREFAAVPDLCGMAARRAGELRQLAEADSLKVIACYSRAVRWLLDFAGLSIGQDRLEVLNMRTQSAEEIIKRLPRPRPSSDSVVALPDPEDDDGWAPWFPVIDYDRCVECGQCLSFCLFGVYARAKRGKITVANPENCKNKCPACARICPEAAIIFPKAEDDEIAGAEVAGKAVKRRGPAALKEKIKAGDLQALLAERRKSLRNQPPAQPGRDRERDCNRATEERDRGIREAEDNEQTSSH